MIIIGLTGTLGAGKGTVVAYLTEKGFAHYSARRFIETEITRRGLPINRDTMTEISNDLRRTHSPAYIIQELYREALAGGKNAIIESIRTIGEIESLKAAGNFYLIAVDADQMVRFERITKRGSATDYISFEKFVADEKREYTSADPTKQNLLGCIQKADFNVTNNGSIEELHKQIDTILATIQS